MAEFNSYDEAMHRVFSRYHLLKTVWEHQAGKGNIWEALFV